MKKTLLTLSISTLLMGPALAGNYEKIKKYEVTIQNITKGQPLTPPVLVTHSGKVKLFSVGMESSKGLGYLATDGQIEMLVNEINEGKAKNNIMVGEGVILPGGKAKFTIETKLRRPHFSIASMLARTNDAFVGLSKMAVKLRKNQTYSTLLSVYDAGVEANTESCAHIPAPPCGNAGVGTEDSEGFVRPHEGIAGNQDLLLSRDSFATKAAKLTIKRIK